MPDIISLPTHSGTLSAIDLLKRRSGREFTGSSIDLECLGTILYAAQGTVNGGGKRLIPSAGNSYPLRIRVAARNVASLKPGFYLYEPVGHALEFIEENSAPLSEIADAAFDAPWLGQASAVLLIAAEFERTTIPYADQPPKGRADRYVWLEAGHAAQNVALAAAALSLATVFVGGFHDDLMSRAFRLESRERPIGVLPLAYPR